MNRLKTLDELLEERDQLLANIQDYTSLLASAGWHQLEALYMRTEESALTNAKSMVQAVMTRDERDIAVQWLQRASLAEHYRNLPHNYLAVMQEDLAQIQAVIASHEDNEDAE